MPPRQVVRYVSALDGTRLAWAESGAGEPLVAYRWDGEADLEPAHFVSAK